MSNNIFISLLFFTIFITLRAQLLDCQNTTQNCTACDLRNPKFCSKCNSGLELVQYQLRDFPLCITPEFCGLPNCASCVKTTTDAMNQPLPIPVINCGKCEEGYRLVMDMCLPFNCVQKIKNCLVCADDSTCSKCRGGFKWDGSSCSAFPTTSSCSNSTCTLCTTTTPSECLVCAPPLVSDFRGTCLDISTSCPSRTFYNILTKNCQPCNGDCTSCYEKRGYCLTCNDRRLNIPPHCPCAIGERPDNQGQCQQICPLDSFYDEAKLKGVENVIQPCSRCSATIPNCASCSDGKICQTCNSGFQLNSSGACIAFSSSDIVSVNNQCLSFPKTSFVPINLNDLNLGDCLPCPPGCEACEFDFTVISKCTQCTDATLVPNADNNFKCVPPKPKIQNCVEFVFLAKWECVQCEVGFSPEIGACVQSCDVGNYFNQTTRTCISCGISNCKNCRLPPDQVTPVCLECNDNFFFNVTSSACQQATNPSIACTATQIQLLKPQEATFQCKDCPPGCSSGCQVAQIDPALTAGITKGVVLECIIPSGSSQFCAVGFKEENTLFNKCIPSTIDLKSLLSCSSGINLSGNCNQCEDPNCSSCRPEKFCIQCKAGFESQMGVCVGSAFNCQEQFRNCDTCSTGPEIQCTKCVNGITLTNGLCLKVASDTVDCDPQLNKFVQTLTINGISYKDCSKCPSRCYNGCQEDLSSGTSRIICTECRPGFIKNLKTQNCDSLCGEGPFAIQFVGGVNNTTNSNTTAPIDVPTNSNPAPLPIVDSIPPPVVCIKCPPGCAQCNLVTAVDGPTCDKCLNGFNQVNGVCQMSVSDPSILSLNCPQMSTFNPQSQKCDCDRKLNLFFNDTSKACEKLSAAAPTMVGVATPSLGQYFAADKTEKDCASINPKTGEAEIGKCATCQSDNSQCFSCMPGFVLVNSACQNCPANCSDCEYDFQSNSATCQLCAKGYLLNRDAVLRTTTCDLTCSQGYLVNVDSFFKMNNGELDSSTQNDREAFQSQLNSANIESTISSAQVAQQQGWDDKYASDSSLAESASCNPMAVTTSGRVICQADLIKLPFQLKQDGAWNLKESAMVRLVCTPCVKNCLTCPKELLKLGNRCTVSCSKGLREVTNSDGKRVCLPLDADSIIVDVQSRQPFRFRGLIVNSITDDLKVSLDFKFADASKPLTVTTVLKSVRRVGNDAKEIQEVSEDILEVPSDEVDLRTQFTSGLQLLDQNKTLYVPYLNLGSGIVYRLEITATDGVKEQKAVIRFVAYDTSKLSQLSDIASVDITNDGTLTAYEGESYKTQFSVTVNVDQTQIAIDDDSFKIEYFVTPRYLLQESAKFRLYGMWTQKTEFNFKFMIPYSLIDLTAVLTVSIKIRNTVYTSDYFFSITKSTQTIDITNSAKLNDIKNLQPGKSLPTNVSTQDINDELSKVKAMMAKVQGDQLAEASSTAQLNAAPLVADRLKKQVFCQIGTSTEVTDIELRCFDNGTCVAKPDGSSGGVCQCNEGFQSDPRCRISDAKAQELKPLIDALKSIISGAAAIASSSTSGLGYSQSKEFLTTLQQIIDTNVADKTTIDNVNTILDKISETALTSDDVKQAVQIVEFVKNQIQKNSNKIFASVEELAPLTDDQKVTIKSEKSKVEIALLKLSRKFNMLLATTLINNQKDQTINTDDTSTQVTSINTDNLSDTQQLDIPLPTLDNTVSAGSTGNALEDSATVKTAKIAQSAQISGATLKGLQAKHQANDICFRFTAATKDYQSGVNVTSNFLDFAIYKDCAPGKTPVQLEVKDLTEPICFTLTSDSTQAAKCAALVEQAGNVTMDSTGTTWNATSSQCCSTHLTNFAVVSDEQSSTTSGPTTPVSSGSTATKVPIAGQSSQNTVFSNILSSVFLMGFIISCITILF